MSKIREELVAAASIVPKRGESETEFLIRLQTAISQEISQEAWDGTTRCVAFEDRVASFVCSALDCGSS